MFLCDFFEVGRVRYKVLSFLRLFYTRGGHLSATWKAILWVVVKFSEESTSTEATCLFQ